jgi:hypothetical protein
MSDLELAQAGLAAWRRDFDALGTVMLLSRPAEVRGPDWPEETVIAITVRAGKVVAMQDHRTLADARRASNQA